MIHLDRAAAAREHALLVPMGRPALALLALLASCSRSPLPGNRPGDAAVFDAPLSDVADAKIFDAPDATISDADDSNADAGPSCAAPGVPGVPDGGLRCGTTSLCDPPRPDGGDCYSVPPFNAGSIASAIWVDDPTASGGGYRIALTIGKPITVGGHTYLDSGAGLVGTGGNGIFGDAVIGRDSDTRWTTFHFEGPLLYRGSSVWDCAATVTITRSGAPRPTVIGRRYGIVRTGPACGTRNGTYTFAAEEPPRVCAFGVDLLSLTLPGQ
jgi:hypothetical protein